MLNLEISYKIIGNLRDKMLKTLLFTVEFPDAIFDELTEIIKTISVSIIMCKSN